MVSDAFSRVLSKEINEAANGALAAVSRTRLEKTLQGIDASNLQNLDLEKLLDIMESGRTIGNDAYIEGAFSDKTLLEGNPITPEHSFLSTDIDDRLRAATIIIQKYPENISEMLSLLWGIYRRMQIYTLQHNINPQSQDLTEYDEEIFNLMDIIKNIALYANSKIVSGAYQTFGAYLFSGNESDLRGFLADPSLLFDVYTHPNDMSDNYIQDFIHALKKNRHSDIVLRHKFPRRTPFLEAFLEALRAQ